MAEIILDPDRGLQDQMREILDLADPDTPEAALVQWNPRPNQPHGGVVVVPDTLAARYENRPPSGPEQVGSDGTGESGTEQPAGRGRRGKQAADAGSGEDKA